MFRRLKKNRVNARQAAPLASVATDPSSFGLFGLYVRSLPKLGR